MEAAEKLAADRTAFERFVQRVDDFQGHIPELNSKIEVITGTLSLKEEAVSVLGQKTDGLETRVNTLQQKQTDLESLQDRLNQVDELSNRTGSQFDALQKGRVSLEKFQDTFYTSRAEIMVAAEKLAVDRTVFEGFVQRVDDFRRRLPGLDAEMETITATLSLKEKAVSVLRQKTDGLETRVDTLQQKQTDLESLQDRLNQVDELSNRTGSQFDALQKSRAELEKVQDTFYTSRAEILVAAEKLAADRTVFEAFVQRVDDFRQRLPGLDSEMEAITATLSSKEKVVSALGQKTDGLETRVDTLQQKQTDLESLQDRLNQVDELSNRTGSQFDALQKSRAELEQVQEEIHAVHTSRADIVEAAEKLAADRTVFEGFVQRVDDFQQRLPGLDSEMDTISAKWSVAKKAVTVLGKTTDRLEDRFRGLLTQAATLQQKQADLESLQDRLNQVDELSNQTGLQFDALQKNRAELEEFQEEIHAVHTSRADIVEAAEKLAADRTVFEGFVQRVDDFQQRMPGLDAEMDTISAKWSVAKKAVTVLGKTTDRLEDRFGGLLTQAAALQQKQADLESLQQRLNQVDELSSRTSYQFDALEKRRAELEEFQKGDPRLPCVARRRHEGDRDALGPAGDVRTVRAAGRRLPAAHAWARVEDGHHHREGGGGSCTDAGGGCTDATGRHSGRHDRRPGPTGHPHRRPSAERRKCGSAAQRVEGPERRSRSQTREADRPPHRRGQEAAGRAVEPDRGRRCPPRPTRSRTKRSTPAKRLKCHVSERYRSPCCW